MHTKNKRIVWWTLPLYLLALGCNKNGTQPEIAIPLDGPGGGVIAYCYQPLTGNYNHQIYGINADGSGNTKLIEADIGLNHHDWAPDGQKLAAVGYFSTETWSIYVFNADGTDLIRLTTTNNVNDSEPVWSPDGTRISFTRIYPAQNNRAELWVMNADGSNQHYIGVEGFAAKWSVDGTRFIYQTSFSGNADINTCNVDGTDIQPLTSTTFDESTPVYSPEGTQIAYVTNHDGNYEIYIMNSDGTNPRRLTNNVFDDYSPRWSSDGLRIAFISGPFRGWEVYIINADGTNMRQLTNSPTNVTAINPVWRPEN